MTFKYVAPLLAVVSPAFVTSLSHGQNLNLRLEPSQSLYDPGANDLVWDASPGTTDEPQTSSDLVTWKPFHRDFPTTLPPNVGMVVRNEGEHRFFRVIRWEGQDSDPPSAVADLTVAESGSTTTLTWTDSTNDDIAFYEVLLASGDGEAYSVKPGVERFTIDIPVDQGFSKGATVRAVDNSGNRSEGISITPAGPGAATPGMTLTVSPSGADIGRAGSTTIGARVEPVPDFPLLFRWSTGVRLGSIVGAEPSLFGTVQLEETTSTGGSQIDYTANPLANPGGATNVYVKVFNAQNPTFSPLLETEVIVNVDPPLPQNAEFRATEITKEYTGSGAGPGHLETGFYQAWVFKIVPGFQRYVFTLLEHPPPSSGQTIGPVGLEWVFALGQGTGSRLDDADDLIDRYGSNIFGLGVDEYAWVYGGNGVSNYKPGAKWAEEGLERFRASQAAKGGAAWSVFPFLNQR